MSHVQNLTSLQKTFHDLKATLDNFKETQENRLTQLEQKALAPRPTLSGLSSTPPALPAPQDVFLETKQFGEFLRGYTTLSTKSLSTGEEPGSLILPHYLQSRILSDLQKHGSFRAIAKSLSISSSAVEFLMDEGLPEARWIEEAAERAETDMSTLRKTRIPVHELYAKPSATQKLLDDSHIDVEAWLVEKVAQTMRKAENLAFLLGDGENQPKGILSYTSAVDTHGVFGCFQEIQSGALGDFHDGRPDILVDVMHQLPTRYLEGALWLMSSSALARIRSLRSPSGRPYHGHSLEEPFRTQIMGYPVVLMDEMPGLAPGVSSKAVIFGNFKEAYQIVDRQEMTILRDPYSNKPYVEFYIKKRVGGDVVNFEALKILNFSTAGEEE